jgi:hypothetical protein
LLQKGIDVFFGKIGRCEILNGALNRGHGSAENLGLLQKGIEFVRPCLGRNQRK